MKGAEDPGERGLYDVWELVVPRACMRITQRGQHTSLHHSSIASLIFSLKLPDFLTLKRDPITS